MALKLLVDPDSANLAGVSNLEIAISSAAAISGLTVATFVTLLLVPALYAIFVKDLRIVRWEGKKVSPASDSRVE